MHAPKQIIPANGWSAKVGNPNDERGQMKPGINHELIGWALVEDDEGQTHVEGMLNFAEHVMLASEYEVSGPLIIVEDSKSYVAAVFSYEYLG